MPPPRPAVTIVDIARLAGVSKSTAARALSGAGNISEATRAAVLEAAGAAGYRRNELARALRRGRTGMVGLLIPDIANPFWADVARGAQDAGSAQDATVLILNSDWDAGQEARHVRALLEARVDGVIINAVRDGLDEVCAAGVPVVLIGHPSRRHPDVPSVRSDIEGGVRLALDAIAAAGFAAPALVVGHAGQPAQERFLEAAEAWARRRGGTAATWLVEEGHFTVEGGRAAAHRLLARGDVLCVFAANDLMALGTLLAVRDRGLDCPGDVAIVGFDGIAAGEFSHPGLATVAKPARCIGRRAMEVVLGGPEAPRPGAEAAGVGTWSMAPEVVLPCWLELRGSLARAAAANGR